MTVTNRDATMATAPADRALTIERIFDAPPAVVFDAWVHPEHARHWMGPRGFTATHVERDVRPGGAWRLCLHQEDSGDDHWQGGVYREIDKPHRLVFTFSWDAEDGSPEHETLITVRFAEHEPGKTTMTFHQEVFKSTESRDGHQDGWTSTFDRLDEFLAKA